MEEKKVCPECENKEQKPVELTDEEMEKTSGGAENALPPVICPSCHFLTNRYADTCENCGAEL